MLLKKSGGVLNIIIFDEKYNIVNSDSEQSKKVQKVLNRKRNVHRMTRA